MLSEPFFILRIIKRDLVINVHCLDVQYPVFLSNLNKLEFSRQIFEKPSNIKFHENPSNGSRVVPRGQTDMTRLIAAFRNFENTPKMPTLNFTRCPRYGTESECDRTFYYTLRTYTCFIKDLKTHNNLQNAPKHFNNMIYVPRSGFARVFCKTRIKYTHAQWKENAGHFLFSSPLKKFNGL